MLINATLGPVSLARIGELYIVTEKRLTLAKVLDLVTKGDSEDDEVDSDKYDESDYGEKLDYQAVWESLNLLDSALPR